MGREVSLATKCTDSVPLRVTWALFQHQSQMVETLVSLCQTGTSFQSFPMSCFSVSVVKHHGPGHLKVVYLGLQLQRVHDCGNSMAAAAARWDFFHLETKHEAESNRKGNLSLLPWHTSSNKANLPPPNSATNWGKSVPLGDVLPQSTSTALRFSGAHLSSQVETLFAPLFLGRQYNPKGTFPL